MRHRLSIRTRLTAATLVTVAVAAGCADDRSDDSATPSTDPGVMSATSPSSSPPSSSSPSPSSSSSGTSTRTSTPRAEPTPPPGSPAPPFVASAEWHESKHGITLKVAPTPAGREAWGPHDAATAWEEVLRLHPDADSPGMWEQFDCHWTWARLLEPNKPTWNVEPWRPVVAPDQMLIDGCNPGGPEV